MLVNKKGHKRQYVYGGSGIFDSIISAVTSKAAKEIASNIAKKTATDLGQKAVNKFIVDKVFKKVNGVSSNGVSSNGVSSNGVSSNTVQPLSSESKHLLNSLLGSGIKRI